MKQTALKQSYFPFVDDFPRYDPRRLPTSFPIHRAEFCDNLRDVGTLATDFKTRQSNRTGGDVQDKSRYVAK